MSNIQNIVESFKGLSVEELLAIITAASAEAKKVAKVVAKAPKEIKEKKGSMPKGVSPPQLHKPRAWVDYVLAHANANGWPAITVKGTDALPASVEKEGKHVFETTGKPLNNKQAMSLSKQYWARKEAVGSNKELYDAFEAQYVPPEPAAPKEAESDTESEASIEVSLEVPTAPKEKKEKKAKKTEEEKKAEKVAAAAAKVAEKEAAALKKAQEKEAAAAAKASAPKPKKVVKKVEEKEVIPPFEFENDGFAHPWDFKGKKFLRDFDGNMWFRTEEGESAGWAGKIDAATGTIDASAEEPEYEDEE